MSRITAAFWDAATLRSQENYVHGRAQSAAFAVPKPHAWDQTLNALRAMRGLTDDWDGNGAIAPMGELIESAIDWALYLAEKYQPPPSSVMAGPNGTIVLNWQDENGFLDAEVTKPHYVEWMQMVPGRPTQHGALELITSLEGPQEAAIKEQYTPRYERIGLAEQAIATVGVRSMVERMISQGRTLAGTT